MLCLKHKIVLVLISFLFNTEVIWAQQQCVSMDYHLTSDRDIINITSPYYPNAYQPGSSCRHRITAPMDHVVILTCFFEVFPNSCDTENFFISLDGDLQFRDAERICRNTQITRISYFRPIALAYTSSRPNTPLRGRFICQARARRQPCNCGWSLGQRIANGQEARHNEFPSTVALRDITSPQRLFCGGNIISHRHILTAAHCTRLHTDPSLIVAYAGDHNLLLENETPYAMQYRIQSILNHPDYASTATSIINDIAILITRIPIEWSRGVGPICLPWRQITQTFDYSTVDVAGWGTLSFAGSKSNTLQKIQLMIITNPSCQSQYNDLLPSQMCTSDYRGLAQDSCQYDSGGPVMLRQQQRLYLLGIISYGRSCGQRYGIGVNTRITSHLGWIWRYTKNDVCVV
ncbi:venom serine protease-like [Cochliomyia hominivorax]